MEPAGLSVTAVAAQLGVDRKTLSRVINGRASVSVEMALLLARAFRTTPQLWLNMQRNYDVWRISAELAEKIKAVRPFAKAEITSSPQAF
jgi:addiction module HigA family antidote